MPYLGEDATSDGQRRPHRQGQPDLSRDARQGGLVVTWYHLSPISARNW